jgi:hypothetical protein
VYVEPGAEPTITAAQEQALAQRIRASGRPIYVAVIDEQDDAPDDVVHEIAIGLDREGLGRDGTYVVVAGGEIGVHSTELEHAVSERLAAGADARPERELAATLNGLVQEVSRQPATSSEEDGSTPWAWVAVALVGIAAVAGGATVWALRHGRGAAGDLPPPPAASV